MCDEATFVTNECRVHDEHSTMFLQATAELILHSCVINQQTLVQAFVQDL